MIRSFACSWAFLWVGLLAACGGASAEGPLTVPIGTTRDQLAGDLRRHQYCVGKEFVPPEAVSETFPRCDTPGVEQSQSWVVAHFEHGRAVKIQRWERFAEADRGLARFNELVEKRATAAGPPSEDAKALIGAQQPLPAGTKTWAAFRAGDDALVGIYLLDPTAPQNAQVLEEIVELAAPAP